MTFKEGTEHLGLDQESGEWSRFTEEEEPGKGKLSGSVKNGMKTRMRAAKAKTVCA